MLFYIFLSLICTFYDERRIHLIDIYKGNTLRSFKYLHSQNDISICSDGLRFCTVDHTSTAYICYHGFFLDPKPEWKDATTIRKAFETQYALPNAMNEAADTEDYLHELQEQAAYYQKMADEYNRLHAQLQSVHTPTLQTLQVYSESTAPIQPEQARTIQDLTTKLVDIRNKTMADAELASRQE